MYTPRRLELAPSRAQPGPPPQLLLPAKRVQHVELVRGAGTGAARTGPTSRRAARWRPPRPRAQRPAPTRRPACGRHRTRGARRSHLPRPRDVARAAAARRPRRACPAAAGARPRRTRPHLRHRRVRQVLFRAEQQPDCLREDRLPRTGLTGDRIQPRRQVELGLADEDEVLDAQPTKQRSRGSG